MYYYIIPIYFIPDLRVKARSRTRASVAPVCFAVDSRSGMIMSYAFSYGYVRGDLFGLGMLGARERVSRPNGPCFMFRSALGSTDEAEWLLDTDHVGLSLNGHYGRAMAYNWLGAGDFLKMLFYDWPYEVSLEVYSFKEVSPRLYSRILDHLVVRFNSFVESGDISLGAQKP